MRVLVTGISGFIGQYLAKYLLEHEYDVHGLYEHEASFSKNPDEVIKHVASLTDFTAIDDLVEELQPDFVIHLAAKTEVAHSFENYLQVSQVNYVGTVNLAEANRKYNDNLKLFIMASTMEAYGLQPPKLLTDAEPFTEKTPQHPMAPYSVAKMAAEHYLEYMSYAYALPFCILRQTNAYGRTDNDFFVMERIVSQMMEGTVCNLGEPDPVRNFIYIDDLVNLYGVVLNNIIGSLGQTFVTGPANGIRIEDLANLIAKKLDWDGEIHWRTIPKRPGEIYYLNSNPEKAKRLLGWEPKVSLEEGIDKLIAMKRGKS